MSILLCSTLANETTPYYGLAGSGAVSQIVAGTSISLSPSGGTGAVTVSSTAVPAAASPTELTSAWGAGPYPTSPATGLDGTQTYVAPRSGVYLLQFIFAFNVNPESVVTGPSDFISAGICTSGPFAQLSACQVFPVVMSAAGADYALRGSAYATLVAGTTYTLNKWVDNISTTLVLAGATSNVTIRIVPLC